MRRYKKQGLGKLLLTIEWRDLNGTIINNTKREKKLKQRFSQLMKRVMGELHHRYTIFTKESINGEDLDNPVVGEIQFQNGARKRRRFNSWCIRYRFT